MKAAKYSKIVSVVFCAAVAVLGSESAFAQSNGIQVVKQCVLKPNPDVGVEVQVIELEGPSGPSTTNPLLVAVVLSAGNILPKVLGSYPVHLGKPNGAGIIRFQGKGFYFEIDTQTRRLKLDTSFPGAPLHMVGVDGHGTGTYSCSI